MADAKLYIGVYVHGCWRENAMTSFRSNCEQMDLNRKRKEEGLE